MTRIVADKFASSTRPLKLANPLEISREVLPEAGTAVVVRALTENPMYPDVELVDGSFSRVKVGDVIAGVLGSRQALRGYVGYAPYKISAGDRIHLLNLGGVLGRCIDGHKDLGPAIEVEVLGGIVKGRKPVALRDHALPVQPVLAATKPVILVMGSCMNVGKTAAAVEIVQLFTRRGLKVGAAKVSGIACLKDIRRMEAAGAARTHSFLDCGVPSTVDAEDLSGIARSLAAELSRDCDLIVMELGDGILGHYHVDSVLDDRAFMDNVDAIVFCASDLLSAWGAREVLERKGARIDVVCGPSTDTCAGTSYIENVLSLPAANALTEQQKLYDLLATRVEVHHG